MHKNTARNIYNDTDSLLQDEYDVLPEDSSGKETKPFGNIALALSGGGYRAAGFHLGGMSYLNHLGILKDVHIISTVSGGTFTGMGYAISLAENSITKKLPVEESFNSFYEDFKTKLLNSNLINRGLEKLGKLAPHTLSGDYNFITSVADIYNKDFCNGKTLSYLSDNASKMHLKEIIFNSTEFKTGTAFRFQVSENEYVCLGNGNMKIKNDFNQYIRLADILAASSCFPGGFEPIAFPDDFDIKIESKDIKDKDTLKKMKTDIKENISNEIKSQKFKTPIPLMDGGIYDNQGIGSLLLAANRQHIKDIPDKKIDLFIVSDTYDKSYDIYNFPEITIPFQNKLNDFVNKTKNIICAFNALSIYSGATFCIFSFILICSLFFGWNNSIVYLILIYSVILHAILFYLSSKLKKPYDYFEEIVKNSDILNNLEDGNIAKDLLKSDDFWKSFKNLTIKQIARLLLLRGGSLIAMTAGIFLNRVRTLSFGNIFDDGSHTPQHRPLTSIIYQLSDSSYLTEERKKILGNDDGLEEIRKVCIEANKMQTTLWFTGDEEGKEKQLNALVCCGRLTMCAKILIYIEEIIMKDNAAYTDEIKFIHKKVRKDWETLKIIVKKKTFLKEDNKIE